MNGYNLIVIPRSGPRPRSYSKRPQSASSNPKGCFAKGRSQYHPEIKRCFGNSTTSSHRKEANKMPSPLGRVPVRVEGQIDRLTNRLNQGEVTPTLKSTHPYHRGR